MASLKFGTAGRRRMAAVDVMEMAKTIAERDNMDLDAAKTVAERHLANQRVAEMNAELGLPNMHDKAAMDNRAAVMASFLRLLRDHDIIKCKTPPHLAETETRFMIHKLAYIATRIFALRPGYWFIMYGNGPFSPELSADFYFVRNIGNHKPITQSAWPARDKFLKFVADRDKKWFEATSTLHFQYEDKGLNGISLIERVQNMYPDTDVNPAYDDLKNAGFLNGVRHNA